ncbi:camp-dependent protein kinase catalytic subunit [Ascosphaera aggregata]|nr:camp-dependent protein kinase catalytic subunit [Ascosphaera aggregata]
MPLDLDKLWDDIDAVFAPQNHYLKGIGKALDRAAADAFDTFDVPLIPDGRDPREHRRKNTAERALAAARLAPPIAGARVGRRVGGDFALKDFSFRYQIGGGGFGTVHLARCNIDGKYYAVKSQAKAKVADHYKQCNEEIRLQRKCRKPWVAGLIGTFQDANFLFMVLELEPGDFDKILKTKGLLSRWACGICFYEMLCGRLPFERQWPLAAKGQISREAYGRLMLKGPQSWPTSDAVCLDFLKKILEPDQSYRIGVRQGIHEFKAHPFFEPIPFDRVWTRATRSVPFQLPMKFDFEKRDNSAKKFGQPGPDRSVSYNLHNSAWEPDANCSSSRYGKLFNY